MRRRLESVFGWRGLLVLALGVGIFLRWFQLGTQVLLDDEWHAIHELLNAGARSIATHFGIADYSIPLTLYYRFLSLHGGLTEWGMRLPIVVCGTALLAIAPWLLRRRAAPLTLAIWTGLLAISPVLVYLSRTARPYAITNLLVFVAIIAIRQWWLRGEHRARWAMVYVFCTFLAGWLHLLTLPFTLLPFVIFGLGELRHAFGAQRAHAWQRIGQLVLLGLLTALPLAAALLPPILVDWGALVGKAGANAVTLASFYRTWLMCFGIASAGILAALVVLCGLGAISWWRRDRAFVVYVGTIVIVTTAVIALAHPAWIQHPGVYARYLQPALPFVLLFVAEGLAWLLKRLWPVLQAAIALLALIGLYYAGPIPGYIYNPDQFMGHPYFQFDYDPAHNVYRELFPDGVISPFYRDLAKRPPRSLTLIEAPWSMYTYRDPLQIYQKIHHQYVKIGMLVPLCGIPAYNDFPPDGGIQLTQFVYVSSMFSGDSHGADFLVIHLHPWPSTLPQDKTWPDVGVCLKQIEGHFGAPAYRDGEVVVFGLSQKGKAVLQAMGVGGSSN